MKTQELPTINGDAELTIRPDFQDSPFVITGPVEAVEPIATEIQALDAREGRRDVQRRNVASKALKAATEPENGPQLYELPTVRDRVATWIADRKLRQFDKFHDTNLYEQKQEQRRKTAIFLMASEAGLFDTAHDSYKRQLNRLVK